MRTASLLLLLTLTPLAVFAQARAGESRTNGREAGTLCETGCSGNSMFLMWIDANGHCAIRASYPCFPYACSARLKTCRDKCTSDGDCAAGAKCNSAKSECVPTPASCRDPFTIITAAGHEESCRPYKCVAGSCHQQCSETADCSSGFHCANAHCTK